MMHTLGLDGRCGFIILLDLNAPSFIQMNFKMFMFLWCICTFSVRSVRVVSDVVLTFIYG